MGSCRRREQISYLPIQKGDHKDRPYEGTDVNLAIETLRYPILESS